MAISAAAPMPSAKSKAVRRLLPLTSPRLLTPQLLSRIPQKPGSTDVNPLGQAKMGNDPVVIHMLPAAAKEKAKRWAG
jgi:hypothetical protein